MAMAKKTKNESGAVTIEPVNIIRTTINVEGTAPLVMHKFSQKAREALAGIVTSDTPTKNTRKAKKEARDFSQECADACHRSAEGWVGIPCTAIKSAMVRACSLVGLVMTQAKLSLFVVPDGFDKADGTPLTKMTGNQEYEESVLPARLPNGSTVLVARPMWRKWSASPTIDFDASSLSHGDIVNLLNRAGLQVGIMEGRPSSKSSCGMGWGTFIVK